MIPTIAEHSCFPIENIPFGIFSTRGGHPKAGVAVGDHILDLEALAGLGVFEFDNAVFSRRTLNAFIRLGKKVTTKVRTDIQSWLRTKDPILSQNPGLFVEQSKATMHMPVEVGDYTDFYSSIEHATNVGKMFRGPDNALLPNWRHIPVGYHGRASSIILSGQPVRRPKGQILPPNADSPVFSPSKRMDFELEMAFITNTDTALGTSILVDEAEDHIFGMVIFNDWSARDIQKWEYVPLGPFLAKSFASSISPWVVTLEAISLFRVAGPVQQPEVLPYLNCGTASRNFDIELEVGLTPKEGSETIISKTNFKYMYWNMAQQLAHHTVNGCNIKVGDMMASGTISGPERSSFGSLLELSWGGKEPVQLSGNTTRSFLEDHDTVTMRGYCQKDDLRIGFGEVKTQLLPSH